ncbi:ATP-binding protein [Streptomyces sp. RKND-216]|uniref:ATP-binding protein n=1 Tax=Streptomyces sp. RKND-216 TaxID=2562581 RepID=UPI00109DFA36|nr:ATP-binding protein [Streptomyces sp. RKND-216]THA24403.1 ATP-binding protein [Streptomyces sp. RKND-216]
MEDLRSDDPVRQTPGRPAAPLPASAAHARERVLEVLKDYFGPRYAEALCDDVVIADALLVTSELASNAIRHGGGITGFDARCVDDRLTLTVSDPSDRMPPETGDLSVGPTGTGGYGWALACGLARDVTITPRATGGKTVTARLRLR